MLSAETKHFLSNMCPRKGISYLFNGAVNVYEVVPIVALFIPQMSRQCNYHATTAERIEIMLALLFF